MAAMRARAQPAIGSAQWIQDENAQVSLFCGQEAEDFAFSARNEVEWLNEHMAEIFSKDQVNVTDVFKTPGKLRGKTPRMARKRNPLEAREPLSDIFSTNPQSKPLSTRNSPAKIASPVKPAAFKVAEDDPLPAAEPKTNKTTADSGYHGISEDEMEIDNPAVQSPAVTHDTLDDFPHSPSQQKMPAENSSTDRSTAERSFHSAREELTKRDVVQDGIVVDTQQTEVQTAEPKSLPNVGAAGEDVMDIDPLDKDIDDNVAVEESRSSSQVSTPDRPLVRKSSLTFAALPAREPITTKKSLGTRVSRTSHLDQVKGPNQQSTFLERLTGGKSLGGAKQAEAKPDVSHKEELDERPQLPREESDSDSRMAKLHNKSSTQRLHERINMLGKSQPSRPTKSIPAAVTAAQSQYPDLRKVDQHKQIPQTIQPSGTAEADDIDEDDWIQPPQPQHTQTRPHLTKSISAEVMETTKVKETGVQQQVPTKQDADEVKSLSPVLNLKVPARHARVASEIGALVTGSSQAKEVTEALETSAAVQEDQAKGSEAAFTPKQTLDSERYVDGPLSASKSKLQSIMKTARGLFSSSAGVSAQAKMETKSPSVPAPRERTDQSSRNAPLEAEEVNLKKGQSHGQQSTAPPPDPASTEPRKTRSSTEKEARIKEKEAAERNHVEREKERVRQQETIIQEQGKSKASVKEANHAQPKATRQSPRKTQQDELPSEGEPHAQSADSSSHLQGRMSQAQKLKDVRRPMKPAKEAASQPKAPPVNIRIGMPSRRVPLTAAGPSSNHAESLASTQAQTKQPGLVKKASNASLQSTVSHGSVKSSALTSKPKALIAAERKKEQDMKEAQRKLEQKREIERRRAAQQEETRRQEQAQRQEAEKQRDRERAAAAEDPKKIAQRQAIEKRRQEMQKKDQRPNAKPVNEPGQTNTYQQRAAPNSRPELGGARPPSRQAMPVDHPKPTTSHHATNPSKAAIKRVFDPENDGAPSRPAKPSSGPNFQQHDNKRRKTEDEDLEEFPMRPTMQPPIRQSGIRKDGQKASIFNHNYNNAAPPTLHHPHTNSLLKSTTSNQAYQQQMYHNQNPRPGHHPDTAQYRDGNRIPFANNPNPPHQHPAQPQLFKTPWPSKLAQPIRQSPQFPNPENIQLADIATDSEDSESSPDTAQKRQRAASLPEWAQSPNLRQLLEDQEELLDADAVFGPVPSPRIEEMFRERAHKFRNRTSSANWAGSDRLTDEEIRRDVEARARIRRDGGWTYGA